MKDFETEKKQIIFDMTEKGEPVKGCIEKGDMFMLMAQEKLS